MSISSDDLATLRSKLSDEKIIEGLSKTDAQDASDIKELKSKGLSDTQILEGFAKVHENTPKPSKSTISTALDALGTAGQALAYGAKDEASRLGSTSRNVAGNKSSAFDSAADLIGTGVGKDYEPASPKVGLSWEGIKAIPQAVLENAAATGGYTAAASAGAGLGGAATVETGPGAILGAGLGGLLGAGAYGLARYWGKTAEQRAAANGRKEVSSSDVYGALPSAAGQGLVDAVGNRFLVKGGVVNPEMVTGAGLEALKQTGANLGKTMGANAVTAAASDSIGQLGASVGTDKGASFDPSEALHAAQAGALVSGAMKLPSTARSAVMDYRQSKTDASVRDEVAQDLNSPRITGDPNNPKDNKTLIDSAKAIYGNDIQKSLSGVKAQIKDLQESSKPSQHLETALEHADDLLTNVKKGKLDESQVESARENLSETPELLKNILKLNEIHNLESMANVGGEKSGQVTKGDLVAAFKTLKMSAYPGLLSSVFGHPLIGAGAAALPFAAASGARARDSILGNREFIQQYVQRFGGNPEPGAGVVGGSPTDHLAVSPEAQALAKASLEAQRRQGLAKMAADEYKASNAETPNEFGKTPSQLAEAANALAKFKQGWMERLAKEEHDALLAEQNKPAVDPSTVTNEFGKTPKQLAEDAKAFEKFKAGWMAKAAKEEFEANQPKDTPTVDPSTVPNQFGKTPTQLMLDAAAFARFKQGYMSKLAKQEFEANQPKDTPAVDPSTVANEYGVTPKQQAEAVARLAMLRQSAMARLAKEEYDRQQALLQQVPHETPNEFGKTLTEQHAAQSALELQRQRAMHSLAAREYAQHLKAQQPSKIVKEAPKKAKDGDTKAEAPTPSEDAPSASKAPPRPTETVRPETVRIETDTIGREVAKSQIRKVKADGEPDTGPYAAKMKQRADSRHELIEDAKGLKLSSKTAHETLMKRLPKFKENTDQNASSESQAQGHLTELTKGMSPIDRATVSNHFNSPKTSKHGYSFMGSYKHKSSGAVAKARKVNASTHKGQQTKRKKKKTTE